VIVDSYRFLPRSFRPIYEGRGAFPGEETPVWTAFAGRLSGARIALLTSAGLYLRGSQDPFDLDRERENPEWGDPGWRPLPAAGGEPAVSHLHVNDADLLADPEIALPRRALESLVAEGVAGSAAAEHYSVMGYQERRLEGWRTSTAPAILDRLKRDQVGGVVLAPA
jgi:D-proline reductase (dithiol) PrdB